MSSILDSYFTLIAGFILDLGGVAAAPFGSVTGALNAGFQGVQAILGATGSLG